MKAKKRRRFDRHYAPRATFESLETRQLLTTTISPVHVAGGGPDIAGATSELTRGEDQISLQIETDSLTAGDAVSGWWVVFNNPEFCSQNCSADDLRDPNVNAAVLGTRGQVVGEDGTVSFTTVLAEGDVSGLDSTHESLPGAGVGLVDASKAEIHFALRSHGPASEDSAVLDTQLTTFNDACFSECVNVQATAHLSPDMSTDNRTLNVFRSTELVDGSNSRLLRTEDHVSFRIDATELPRGEAVTVWWVFFNHPEHCSERCSGPDDLRDTPAVGGGAFYADGQVVADDGTATFTGTRSEGDASGLDVRHAGLPGAELGLVDAEQTEVHLVLRSHGVAHEDPALRAAQLTSFTDGCNPECQDLQAVRHFPLGFGDFDNSGQVDASDVDMLMSAMGDSSDDRFDIFRDGIVDANDVDYLVSGVLATLAGDADLDGDVDFADFTSLSNNFGQDGGWSQGDFDGNGKTDFGDFLMLSSNFGAGGPA